MKEGYPQYPLLLFWSHLVCIGWWSILHISPSNSKRTSRESTPTFLQHTRTIRYWHFFRPWWMHWRKIRVYSTPEQKFCSKNDDVGIDDYFKHLKTRIEERCLRNLLRRRKSFNITRNFMPRSSLDSHQLLRVVSRHQWDGAMRIPAKGPSLHCSRIENPSTCSKSPRTLGRFDHD